MRIITNLIEDIRFIVKAKRMLNGIAYIDAKSSRLVPDDFEEIIDKFPDNIAFIDDTRQWSYRAFEAYANQVAHWAQAQDLKRGDTVAIFAQNRLEYVALWFGLSKVGIIPALINFQLKAAPLAHCVTISKAKAVIVDHDLRTAWKSAKAKLPDDLKVHMAFEASATGGTEDTGDIGRTFETALNEHPKTRPNASVRAGMVGGDMFMKMFTSGTTGMPKAAKLIHSRGQYMLRGFVIASDAKPTDRTMMVLPLYHATGGLCGVGLALLAGGAVIVRKKFSASNFWSDAVRFKATMFMYVGELCRFLQNAPADPQERAHHIRLIVGNGLRPEVWAEFVERFNIPKVIEFYGATEGNISLVNISDKVGSVGRVPEFFRNRTNGDLIKFDVESNSEIRGADGLCQRTEDDEVGELIGEIRQKDTVTHYEGYEDKKASDQKILRDVYEKGDTWFRTGDLLWRDKRGFFYFADRMGDTFRWKAENVATNEVATAVNGFEGIDQANVYGVPIPHYDGKAGMASFVAAPNLDLTAFYDHLKDVLPAYARPVFLRISHHAKTTGTFKYKKIDLVKDGFDPKKIKDKMFLADPEQKKFVPLTPSIFKNIQAGKYKL